MLRIVRQILGGAFVGGAASIAIREHVVDLVDVEGASMLPTLNTQGDLLLCEKWTKPENLKIGDIVLFRSLHDPKLHICKRIAGTENMEYYETTSNPLFGDTVVAKKIPQNHLFVKGDNPTNSVDSRDFGPIPLGVVHGRVCARVWPPSLMCTFPRGSGQPLKDPLVHSITPDTPTPGIPTIPTITSTYNTHNTHNTYNTPISNTTSTISITTYTSTITSTSNNNNNFNNNNNNNTNTSLSPTTSTTANNSSNGS